MSDNNKSKLMIILSMVIFGTIGVFRKYIPTASSLLALYRAFIGALCLVVFILITRRGIDFKSIKKNLLWLILSGTALSFNWMFLFESYNYTTVATATICYYMAPVIVMMVSSLIFKDKISMKKWLCIAVAFIGMVLTSGIFKEGGLPKNNVRGIVYGLLAASLYAAVILLNQKLKELGAFDKTIIQLFVAGLVMIPYVAATQGVLFVKTDLSVIILILSVGLLHTGVAYALYFGAMKGVKAYTAALLSYIDPIVAILLSALLLKESLSLLEILGAVLVLGSMMVSEK